MMSDKTNILKMEDILKNSKRAEESKHSVTVMAHRTKQVKTGNLVPRGKPKSGRIWKSEKNKFSSIIKSKGIKSTLEKNKKLKEKLLRVKEASRAIVAAKKEEKERKKQRRRENLKRQEENKKKAEIVQVITNTKKLKKIKRKHLKYIEKRDVTVVNKSK